MNHVQGIGVSKGQAFGVLVALQEESYEVVKKQESNAEKEVEKLQRARKDYQEELVQLYNDTLISLGEDAAKIFGAYIEIVNDNVFFEQVASRTKKELCNIEYSLDEEKKSVMNMMSAIDDSYLKERAVDIENVCNEIIRRILGIESIVHKMQYIREDFIVVANDLTPADTVRLDKKHLKGFVTEKGGKTSHTVILAKTLGIPAIIGAHCILESCKNVDKLYINGDTGEIVIDPDEEFLTKFRKIMVELEAEKKELEEIATMEAITQDGYKVEICVNSGDPESIRNLDPSICDGIGLFRTEFLYMNHTDYPTEDEQFTVYKEVVQKMNGKEVVIRTLDIGGDKQLCYMNLSKEDNPFLGYRAIRICLERKEMFITQLKAILRASHYGKIGIMFPMIVNVEECLQSKAMVKEAMKRLDEEKLEYDKNVKLGIMIETPAAVLLSDKLAKEMDFFSIGTNDLIQYTVATDRMNEQVQYLYDSCNISVLRSIQIVINEAHKVGTKVSICGEAASDERLIPLWVGMGIDKLSMVPTQTMRAKYIIMNLSKKEKEELCKQALAQETVNQVKKLLG